MTLKLIKPLLALLFFAQVSFGQNSDAPLLKTIVSTYYKTEKPIYKGRNQLLFFYCDKANNNEEIFETVNQLHLPKEESKFIKNQVNTDTQPESWSAELDEIYASDQSNLKIKINACLSLDEYHIKQKKFNLNNQRLMIISKPVFWRDGKTALVKVVFYRSIEHNNGSVLLMQKTADNNWIIKESLNPWST
jgi:hypothetical protein